jgi:hypothetical protein
LHSLGKTLDHVAADRPGDRLAGVDRCACGCRSDTRSGGLAEGHAGHRRIGGEVGGLLGRIVGPTDHGRRHLSILTGRHMRKFVRQQVLSGRGTGGRSCGC